MKAVAMFLVLCLCGHFGHLGSSMIVVNGRHLVPYPYYRMTQSPKLHFQMKENAIETEHFKNTIIQSMGEMIDQKLNEYDDTIEEAFETLNELMKEMIEMEEYISDIDDNFLSLENQNPRDGTYPTSNHKSDYGDIIRLSKK